MTGCVSLYWWTVTQKQQVNDVVLLGEGRSPAFSPNGNYIAFAYNSDLRLKQMDYLEVSYIDAGDLPINVRGTFDWLNENEILYFKLKDSKYSSDTNPDYQLWRYNLQSHKEYLLSNESFDIFPEFALSPSKSMIAFFTPSKDEAKMLLYVFDLTSTKLSMIPMPEEPSCHEPAWSPDNSKLIYTCSYYQGKRNLATEYVWITNLTTGYFEQLTDLTDYRYFSWSPDNKWVSFTHNFSVWLAPVENGKPNFEHIVYLPFNLGSSPFFPTEDFYFTPPGKASWSPDGKSLAVDGLLQNTTIHGIWMVEIDE